MNRGGVFPILNYIAKIGSMGLGAEYVRQFAQHGCYVTLCDIDETKGQELLKEIESAGGHGQFVKCDVTNWEDQVAVFVAAMKNSPHKCIDIVIANAGIAGQDDILKNDENPNEPPSKPSLKTTDIDLLSTMYTTKLALHYFKNTPESDSHDKCLILKSSMAGYVDLPGKVLTISLYIYIYIYIFFFFFFF